jgi:hypothetical protein
MGEGQHGRVALFIGDGGIRRGRVKRVKAARVRKEAEDGLGGRGIAKQKGDGWEGGFAEF